MKQPWRTLIMIILTLAVIGSFISIIGVVGRVDYCIQYKLEGPTTSEIIRAIIPGGIIFLLASLILAAIAKREYGGKY